MDEKALDIIKLVSIIAAAAFGIAGSATETKKKDGSLTKWGFVALFGVILTNSFQFIQTYLEQQKVAKEKDEITKEKEKQSKIDQEKFEKQLYLLYSNINKTDTSLKQQLRLQKYSENVLYKMDKSTDIQKDLFIQSEKLNNQQKEAITEINRTLNPLIPFKVNVRFTINVAEKNGKLFELREKVRKLLSTNTEDEASEKGVPQVGTPWEDENIYWHIDPKYEFYSDYIKLLSKLYFRIEIHGPTGILFGESPKNILSKEEIANNVFIDYGGTEDYRITMLNIPINPEMLLGFYSSKDFENSKIDFVVANEPKFLTVEKIQFKFPPNFSRIKELQGKRLPNKWNENDAEELSGHYAFQIKSLRDDLEMSGSEWWFEKK